MLKAKHSSLHLPFKCFLKIHTKLTSWCRIVKRELSKSPVFAEYMEWRQVRGAADPRLEFNIHISLYFVPGLLKRQNLKFLFIFSSQTLITCFGSTPWSHGDFIESAQAECTREYQKNQQSFFPLPTLPCLYAFPACHLLVWWTSCQAFVRITR